MTAAPEQPVREEDVGRALRVLLGHPEPGPLAALCYDVLSRQAEGRTFFSGRDYLRGRAEAHGVTDGATSGGDLLAVLERGAREPHERALVAAFAVEGLRLALAADEPAEAAQRVYRFVRHADWLEVCAGWRIYPFVDARLEGEAAGRVWREVAQAAVDAGSGRDGRSPAMRAWNVARLTTLAEARSAEARAALREVAQTAALEPVARELAVTLAGPRTTMPASVTPPARLQGRVARMSPPPTWRLLRWLTGWALVSAAARGLAFLVGFRRHGAIRLDGDALAVAHRSELLGRTVATGEERWALSAVGRAAREVRYPSLHLLVGVLALSGGVLFGGLVLFDGVRSGELVLLLLAACLAAGGAALDLVLDLLWPAREGRVSVEIVGLDGRRLRLRGVRADEARAFVTALGERRKVLSAR